MIVLADPCVEIEFGTGVLKITPAHDPVDYAIAKRHGLDTSMNILNKDGSITNIHVCMCLYIVCMY